MKRLSKPKLQNATEREKSTPSPGEPTLDEKASASRPEGRGSASGRSAGFHVEPGSVGEDLYRQHARTSAGVHIEPGQLVQRIPDLDVTDFEPGDCSRGTKLSALGLEIRSSERGGLGLFAKRAFCSGSPLFAEKPFACCEKVRAIQFGQTFLHAKEKEMPSSAVPDLFKKHPFLASREAYDQWMLGAMTGADVPLIFTDISTKLLFIGADLALSSGGMQTGMRKNVSASKLCGESEARFISEYQWTERQARIWRRAMELEDADRFLEGSELSPPDPGRNRDLLAAGCKMLVEGMLDEGTFCFWQDRRRGRLRRQTHRRRCMQSCRMIMFSSKVTGEGGNREVHRSDSSHSACGSFLIGPVPHSPQ